MAAPVKVKIYVATIRLVSEQGPEKPQFTEPLEALLRRRGFEVIEKKAALAGEPPFQPEPGACQLKRVILLDAYFSDRGRLFQSDRGRRNCVAGVALG